jgi:hypothetical protein
MPIPGIVEGVDVGQNPKGSTANPLNGKGTQDSSLLETMKYNIRPRSKGKLDFPRNVARGLGFFEETIPKSKKRGRKYYMSTAQK